MNIVLISPPEQHLLMEAGDRPNMGLLYLAGALRRKGHKTLISDLNHDSYRTLTGKLSNVDFVGIQTFTPYHEWTTNFSGHLKQNYPNIKLVAGGPHATVCPDTLPFFDYIIRGEGESALVDLVNGKTKERVIKYPVERNLDNVPTPHKEMDFSLYGLNQEGHYTMTMVSSRSCDASCCFCTKNILGPRQRVHSPSRVEKEVRYLINRGFKSFYFIDDHFMGDKDRAIEIAERLTPLNITFRATSRTDKVDEDLIKKMSKAGMRSISFGLEHIDDDVLKRIHKGETLESHNKAVDLSKKYGIKRRGSFIINLPGATEETVKRTLKWSKEKDLEFADFYSLIAYPGTPLWLHPDYFRIKIDKNFNFNQTSNRSNVETEELTIDKAKELVDYAREEWKKYKGLNCPWEAER